MGEILLFFCLEFQYHQKMSESYAMYEKESSSGSIADATVAGQQRLPR
jgi:hypothetical protein